MTILRALFAPSYPSSLDGMPFVYKGRHPLYDFRFVIDVWDGEKFVNSVPVCRDEIFAQVQKGIAA